MHYPWPLQLSTWIIAPYTDDYNSITILTSPSIHSTIPALNKATIHSPSFFTGTKPSGSQTLTLDPISPIAVFGDVA